MAWTKTRDRSYWDLSPEDRAKYDELRRKQREASKAKQHGLSKNYRDQADTMLGLRVVNDYTEIDDEASDRKFRKKAAFARSAHEQRIAGTRRDWGHQ